MDREQQPYILSLRLDGTSPSARRGLHGSKLSGRVRQVPFRWGG